MENRELIHEQRRRDDQRKVQALRFQGIEVKSLFDLVNGPTPREAILVLVQILPQVSDIWMKQGVVRALTQRSARSIAARTLIELFRSADREGPRADGLKWAVGNAMSVMGDDSLYDEIAELASDPSHGKSREMLVVALGRMRQRREDAITLLRRLLRDEDICGHALIALRKLNAVEVAADIRPFLKNPRAWVRNEAKKALKRFEN